MTVKVVEELRRGLIVGATFLRQNGSMINFSDGGGFTSTPGLPWVPFVAAGKHKTGEGGAKAPGWHAAPPKKRVKGWRTAPTATEMSDQDAAPWEHFCAIKSDSAEQVPPDIASPSTVPVLGKAAWEDDGTLQWKLCSGKQVNVDDFVSVQTEAFVKSPQPQERKLVLVTPAAPYDLELGAERGVARGVQWWYPYTPVQCKVVNVTNTLKTFQRGTVVANVYAMNTRDVERIQVLVEPPLPDPTWTLSVTMPPCAKNRPTPHQNESTCQRPT